jgi:hypothetical protein
MTLARASLTSVLLATLVTLGAEAQVRFTIDPKTSLAWWQVNPHLNHLWATTCPEEPSWRPGEGRSAGWIIEGGLRTKQGYAVVSDTTVVPLYPRKRVRSVCTDAVAGEFFADDTLSWHGLRGQVAVKAAALITGEERRDEFARTSVLEAKHHPEIRFTIDSAVDVRWDADTLRGTVWGVFLFHGVERAMTTPIRGWREAGGLRVLARLNVSAQSLVEEFKLSRFALGLGVNSMIWYEIFMGVDVVLRALPSDGS